MLSRKQAQSPPILRQVKIFCCGQRAANLLAVEVGRNCAVSLALGCTVRELFLSCGKLAEN